MAVDEGLAQRVREVLAAYPGVVERKMFGGLAFLYRGHMLVGVIGEALMARVGPDAYAAALEEPHVREMDFTGRPLTGFVYVDAAGTETDAALDTWIARCAAFNGSLPPK